MEVAPRWSRGRRSGARPDGRRLRDRLRPGRGPRAHRCGGRARHPARGDTQTETAATDDADGAQTQTETTQTETGASGGSQSELLARGEELWSSTGCAGCHSIDGSAGVGPTVKGLAGSTVTLDDGSTVTADAAYLARSITDPDAQIPEGHEAGIMSGCGRVAGLRVQAAGRRRARRVHRSAALTPLGKACAGGARPRSLSARYDA